MKSLTLNRKKIYKIGYHSKMPQIIKNLLIDFKRRKEYKNIKIHVKKLSRKIINNLELPTIKFLFYKHYDNCSFSSGRMKEIKDRNSSLRFGLNYLYQFKNPKMIDFVVCHEIAHYLQFYKHIKWWNIFIKGYSTYTSNMLYNKQKLERNANKIASILLKVLNENT